MTSSPKSSVFIMAGGSGERFWPWSRTHLPKHLLRLFSEKTLLEETHTRFTQALPSANLRILTNHLQIENISRECPGIPPDSLIGEPAKRDTAPAAALATALAIADGGPEQIVILTPADARIDGEKKFCEDIHQLALSAATHAGIITLGIPPTYPATGFGYLELSQAADEKTITLRRFVEKPDLDKAEQFLQSGNFLWNAGIFAWKASVFLDEARRQLPALAEFISNFPQDPAKQKKYLEEHFPKLPKISVDYAICENARAVYAIKAQFDWDDVGSWDAIPKHVGTDSLDNTIIGEAILHDCTGIIAASKGRTIAALGLQDIVIAESPEAILVAHRKKLQDIKKIVTRLPDNLK